LLPINISCFYTLLHLFNTFLQIGKTFFTSKPYYIRKIRAVGKKNTPQKGGQENEKKKKVLYHWSCYSFHRDPREPWFLCGMRPPRPFSLRHAAPTAVGTRAFITDSTAMMWQISSHGRWTDM
jgi:hypothetical protein